MWVSWNPSDPKKSQCIDQCIQIHQICLINTGMAFTSSLRFLYIFDRSGLLCAGPIMYPIYVRRNYIYITKTSIFNQASIAHLLSVGLLISRPGFESSRELSFLLKIIEIPKRRIMSIAHNRSFPVPKICFQSSKSPSFIQNESWRRYGKTSDSSVKTGKKLH